METNADALKGGDSEAATGIATADLGGRPRLHRDFLVAPNPRKLLLATVGVGGEQLLDIVKHTYVLIYT